MTRAIFSLWVAAALAACVASAPAASPAPSTAWRVGPALGLDALVFVGALSGERLPAEAYAADVARYRAALSPSARAAVDAIAAAMAEDGNLVGPTLALYFSAGPVDTFDDVLASARDPETRLRAGFEASPYWDAAAWATFADRVAPAAAEALEGLRGAGFEDDWRAVHGPAIAAAAATLRRDLSGYDVIGEQARLLGRPLAPEIEIYLLAYSKPYGIKIVGQRFVNHYGYGASIHLRTASHEIFHPPFDLDDAELWASLAPLAADPWMTAIVDDHDPAFGYRTFEGVVNEDAAQALDQIVSERLGAGRVPGERWRGADGGMHLLAAALYRMLKDDGFDARGGDFEAWLTAAIADGRLTAANLRARAAEVVGAEAVDRWDRAP